MTANREIAEAFEDLKASLEWGVKLELTAEQPSEGQLSIKHSHGELGRKNYRINKIGVLAMAWSKGQSGNPKGRAAEKPFADALRMEIKAAGDDHQQLRMIARKLLDKAAEGDMQAITCVADRLDGKPLQQMEVATEAQPFAVIPHQLETAEEWEAAQRVRSPSCLEAPRLATPRALPAPDQMLSLSVPSLPAPTEIETNGGE